MSTEIELHDEAKKLVGIIEEELAKGDKRISKEDWLFLVSMKTRVKFKGEIQRKQIYWLRDIRDRVL